MVYLNTNRNVRKDYCVLLVKERCGEWYNSISNSDTLQFDNDCTEQEKASPQEARSVFSWQC